MPKVVLSVVTVISVLMATASNLAQADTLLQIFDLASKNDPTIRAAEAQLKANQQSRTINRAALLPQIGGSVNRRESETTSDDPTRDSDSTTTVYSASLNQVLFDLPAWYSYKQGDAVAEQAEADYLLAKQDLIIRTTTAYLDVLRAVDTFSSVRSEERAIGSQLEQATERYDVGLIAITDVLEAQAAYDDVTARLLLAQGNLGIAFEGLSVLTGQSHTSIAPLSETFPVIDPMPADSESWVEIALASNQSLTSSELARDAALYNSKSQKFEHLPSLDLTVNYSDNRPEGNLDVFQNSFDSQNETVSITLDVPIFSGGRVSAQRRQAYYQYAAAEENLNNTRRTLIQSTRNLHLTARTTVSTVAARKQAIASSQSALEATRAGYEVGTRNLVDVLIAEQTLYSAELNYYNTRYDYILTMLNLKQAAGTLTSEDLTYYNQYLDISGQIPRSGLTNSTQAGEPSAPVAAGFTIQSPSAVAAPLAGTPVAALEAWASSWEELRIDDYLDYYSDQFIVPATTNIDDWRQARRDRLALLTSVDIDISAVEITSETTASSTIRFDQRYTDGNYSDLSRKEILWVNEDGEWKIRSERALSVTPL